MTVNRDLKAHIELLGQTRVFSAPQIVPPSELLYSALSINGAGIDFGMNVDGSAAQVVFKYIVPAGKIAVIESVSFHLVDGGVDPQDFGGIGNGLTNGCLFHVHDEDDSHLVEIVNDIPIKQNFEFAHLGTIHYDRAGTAQETLQVVWNPRDINGYSMYLTAGQYLAFHVRDNLEAVTHFEAAVFGRLLDAP